MNVYRDSPEPESLKKRMLLVGLPQTRAAEMVKVSYTYFNNILNGKRQHAGHAMRRRLDKVLLEIESGKRPFTPSKRVKSQKPS